VIYAIFYWLFKTETCHFLLRTYESHSDESIILRLEYYGSAISAFLKHPLLGLGFGGWALFHDTLYHFVPEAHDLREVLWRHPHNIGLEVLSETGLIGGLLGIWFGILIFKRTAFRLLGHSFLDSAPILLLAFSLFNALKSGDLNDNIFLFVMAGIVAARGKSAYANS
jgi:O-antigen ligase